MTLTSTFIDFVKAKPEVNKGIKPLKIEEGKSLYYDQVSRAKRGAGGAEFRISEGLQSSTKKSPIKLKYRKKGTVAFPNEKISSPADVAFAFRKLENEAVEHSIVVGTRKRVPLFVEPISIESWTLT